MGNNFPCFKIAMASTGDHQVALGPFGPADSEIGSVELTLESSETSGKAPMASWISPVSNVAETPLKAPVMVLKLGLALKFITR
jgi:hypothetical protein